MFDGDLTKRWLGTNFGSVRINILALFGAFLGFISLFGPWQIWNHVEYIALESWVYRTDNYGLLDFVGTFDWNVFMIFIGTLLSFGTTLSIIILVPGLIIFFFSSQFVFSSSAYPSLGIGFHLSLIALIVILISIFRPMGPGYPTGEKSDRLGRILTLSNARSDIKSNKENKDEMLKKNNEKDSMEITIKNRVLKKWNLIGIIVVVLILIFSIILSTQPTSQIMIHGVYHMEGPVIVSVYFDDILMMTENITSEDSIHGFNIIFNVTMGRHWYGIDHSIKLNGTEYISTGSIDGLIDYHEVISIGPLSHRLVLLLYNAGLQ